MCSSGLLLLDDHRWIMKGWMYDSEFKRLHTEEAYLVEAYQMEDLGYPQMTSSVLMDTERCVFVILQTHTLTGSSMDPGKLHSNCMAVS